MSVCCVLSGRGLCDELITRPEESYRLWCVVVCDQETLRMRRPWPALGRSAKGGKGGTRPCRLGYWWLYSTAYLFVCCTQLNKLKPQSLSWKTERERERERETLTTGPTNYINSATNSHRMQANCWCYHPTYVPLLSCLFPWSFPSQYCSLHIFILSIYTARGAQLILLNLITTIISCEAKGTNYDILHYVIMSILLLGLPPPTIKSL